MSPTQRTLAWLRERGYVCEVVERWNQHSKTRKDLFGMFDVLALDVQWGNLMGVQACVGASHAARVEKLKGSEHLPAWTILHKAAVISWAKRGERGKRKLWTPRIELL